MTRSHQKSGSCSQEAVVESDSSSDVEVGGPVDAVKSIDSMSETSRDGTESGQGDSTKAKASEVMTLAVDLLESWKNLKVSSFT